MLAKERRPAYTIPWRRSVTTLTQTNDHKREPLTNTETLRVPAQEGKGEQKKGEEGGGEEEEKKKKEEENNNSKRRRIWRRRRRRRGRGGGKNKKKKKKKKEEEEENNNSKRRRIWRRRRRRRGRGRGGGKNKKKKKKKKEEKKRQKKKEKQQQQQQSPHTSRHNTEGGDEVRTAGPQHRSKLGGEGVAAAAGYGPQHGHAQPRGQVVAGKIHRQLDAAHLHHVEDGQPGRHTAITCHLLPVSLPTCTVV